jgi:hypothetical protein
MVALGQSHYSNVRHYGVAMSTFFTPSNQQHLLEALRCSDLPEARFYEPTDLAAISALNTTRCLRHFEFNCTVIVYNPRPIIFLEYSNSTWSSMLYHFCVAAGTSIALPNSRTLN